MSKPSLEKNSRVGEDDKIYTFLKGIIPKVNVIVQREFKVAYFKATVQHVNHDAMGNNLQGYLVLVGKINLPLNLLNFQRPLHIC